MNFLTLEHVSRSYGEKLLFKDITLHIDKGQKIGLIAKNGSGKSTLMRVIAGMEGSEGEQSVILLRKDVRIGWLDQEPEFDPTFDVLGAVLDDDKNPVVRAVKAYEMALTHPAAASSLAEAMAAMDDFKAWTFESKVKEMLSRFNLNDYEQKVSSLSGGQKKRLALVRILLQEPEFLILDEPTNHLDVEMIEWLEEYLQQPSITLFMVTHDRYFLENICDSIIELEGGVLHRYKGSYSDYLEKKSLREELESTTYEKNRKLLKTELEWVRKSPAARTTKSKARVDTYFNKKNTNDELKPVNERVELHIKESWLGGKIVELHNVGKGFGDKKLIENFTYKFKRKERVGIIGANGAGKSTFLELITKQMQPDTGKIVVGDTVTFGHYKQDGIKLAEDKRVIDAVRDIAEVIPLEKGKEMNAAQLLERFLFSRPQQQVYVSQLSGGERRRLYLLTILMKNPNFLILDEPTNDLDVMTLQVLEDFLEDFPGCLLIVTHDRYFMDRLVEHLFVFEGDGVVRDFNGSHAEYRAIKRTELLDKRAQGKSGADKKTNEQTNTAVANKPTAEQQKASKKLEKDMQQLEQKKKNILEKFENVTPQETIALSKELADIQSQLDDKEMQWLELNS